MSKSLLVRFHGFGDYYTEATAFTTNELPTYQVGIGIKAVVSVPDSFSSSVTPFEPVGSDPSVSISLLNTPDVRRVLLNSALVPVKRSFNGETIRTKGYIPTTRPFTVEVTDATPFNLFDEITIANERLVVTAIPTPTSITIDTASESIPTPKSWSSVATGVGGVPIYRSRPSLEGAFVSIAIIDGVPTLRSQEEVVFRGFVRGWSMDTSAGGPALLKVNVGGLLSALSTRVLMPPPVKITALTWEEQDDVWRFEMIYPSRIGGEAPDVCVDGYTAPSFIYVVPKKEGLAGVWSFWQVGTRSTRIDSTDEPGTFLELGRYTGAAGFPLSIGYGSRASVLTGNPMSVSYFGDFGASRLQNSYLRLMTTLAPGGAWMSLTYDPETNPGSVMFAYYGYGFVDVIRSLFTGRNNVDPNAEYPASMAAWLPVSCIDQRSIGRFQYIAQPQNLVTSSLGGVAVDSLPPADVDGKTLLDFITESVLAPNAGCIVQDGGVLRILSWAGIASFPRNIGIASLANPSASLTSSRSSYLKQVNVTIGPTVGMFWDRTAKLTPEATDVFYSDYYTGGVGGKVITIADNSLAVMQITGGTGDDPPELVPRSLSSTAGNYALNLIGRWGTPAPVLTLTLRDKFVRLQLGEDVSVTLDQIPGNDGGMGISNAAGVVIESVRSWSKGETEYKIALIGYTPNLRKPGYWAATAELDGAQAPGALNVYPYKFNSVEIANAVLQQEYGVPANDADAFAQTGKRSGAPIYLALYNARGVLLPTATYPVLDVPNTVGLTVAYTGTFFPTVPAAGMIVTLAPYAFQPAADTLIDAYLADPNGTVAGQDPWTWAGS